MSVLKNEGFKIWTISCKVVEVYIMDINDVTGKVPDACGAFHLERHLIFHFTSFEGSFQGVFPCDIIEGP